MSQFSLHFILLLSKNWNIKDISSVIWILEETSEKQVKISPFALILSQFHLKIEILKRSHLWFKLMRKRTLKAVKNVPIALHLNSLLSKNWHIKKASFVILVFHLSRWDNTGFRHAITSGCGLKRHLQDSDAFLGWHRCSRSLIPHTCVTPPQTAFKKTCQQHQLLKKPTTLQLLLESPMYAYQEITFSLHLRWASVAQMASR